MAVFMSPRPSYVLGRFGPHSFMSWIVVVFLVLGLGVVTGSYVSESDENLKNARPQGIVLSVLAGGTLFSKKGRKTLSRISVETFYGTLHSFTGVWSSNYNDEVGRGGSSKEI